MSKFASGKKAWAISDRTGLRVRYRELVTEWNGSRVAPDEYEEKHPQLRRRRRAVDAVALRDPRPDNDHPLTIVNLQSNNAGRSINFAVGHVSVEVEEVVGMTLWGSGVWADGVWADGVWA